MAVSINESVRYPVTVAPQTGVTYPNFRGADTVSPNSVFEKGSSANTVSSSNVLEKSPSADTVEISSKKEKKKGLSTGAKVAIGVGSVLTLIVGGAFAISKHQTNKLQKLYKEKLVPKIFDKELTYNKDLSKEDAIKYAKEILGVKNIDPNMTKEALDYANRGIVDVVNKNIGQEVFIPRSYACKDLKDNVLAHVVQNIKSNNFGEFAVNKKLFDNEWLTKELDKRFELRDFAKNKNSVNEKSIEITNAGFNYKHTFDDELRDLCQKYIKDPNGISVEEKRVIFYSTGEASMVNSINKFDYIKFVENHSDKITLNPEELSKLSPGKQFSMVNNHLKEKGISLDFIFHKSLDDGISTVYHEMGHLQDFAKNLKELDLKTWKIPTWKDAKEQTEAKKAGKKVEDRIGVDELENRWGGTTYDGFEILLKEHPEEFKKLYPDLYEHLTNKEIKETSLKVSHYASTSIGEFVAEVYKMMISGREIPSDVMNLYKKYNGPLPNGFK